jgi:signal transduction histidine kinase
MGLDQRRPLFRLDASRLDDEVAASALPISMGGGWLMVLVGLAHLLVLPPNYRVPMMWITEGIAALLLVFRLGLQFRRLPRGWGHPFVVFMGALLLVPGMALMAWSVAPRESVNLMLVVLAGGVVLLSYGWMLVLIALAWFGYAAIVTLAPANQDWVHYGSAFLGVSVLALVLVTIRLSMFERLYSREAALASTLQDLQRSNEALEQFAYAVSHDLQAPIRAISGYAAILRDEHADALDDESRGCVGQIERGATHMGELVRDLLDYARVGSRGAEFRDVALDAVLDRALENLSIELSRQGAQVVREPLPKVSGDELQLVQLFQNLVGNAVKFHGDAAPVVRITARREGATFVVSVSDNGIGISPEYHERVFRVFERLHSGATYPGTGIGLATCQRVVERHGGRIWVDSVEGQGATFSFSLPVGPAA